ncbi:hypothetical protein G9A89_015529 [Geosiphon pyriformis]|nr:hypothetical protein G9A89_015529 [Geosiphon pyriformis]
MPITETFMALELLFNWAEKTEQEIFEEIRVENRTTLLVLHIEKYYQKNAIKLIETPFDATYNSALNKLYYYPHNAEMIYKLAMVLINRRT